MTTPDYEIRRYPAPDSQTPPSRRLSTAYTLTCDAGECNHPTAAIVYSIEGLWLSMCNDHARAELEILR